MSNALISWEEARGHVNALQLAQISQQMQLIGAVGKRLYEDVHAKTASPPFDNSAVDGYAVFPGFDGFEELCLEGSLFAGSAIPALEYGSHQAIRVLTGSPVPMGADRVVMQEDCVVDGKRLRILAAGKPGQHIRWRAEDFSCGDLIVQAGASLTPGAIGFLASAGIAEVSVLGSPRVGLLITGDELTDPGQELEPGKIYNSNQPALIAALAEMGVCDTQALCVQDSFDQTVDSLRKLGQECDFVVTVGGLAEGDRDHVLPALETLGADPVFSRVAIKPGKPVSLYQFENKPVFCLPGNPVSALVTMFLFVRPYVAASLGVKNCEVWSEIPLAKDMYKKRGRAEFVPGTIIQGRFEPISTRGSHLLNTLSQSTHFALFPPESACLSPGEFVSVVSVDWRMPCH